MSENRPEDQGRKEPRVIDLEAEEIKAEDAVTEDVATTNAGEAETKSDAEDVTREENDAVPLPPPPPPLAPPRKKRGAMGWIAVGLLAATLAGGWIYRDFLSGYLPTAEMTAMKSRLDGLEANGKTMGEQLLAVSQASDAATSRVAAVDTAVKSTVTGLAEAAARLDGIEARFAAAETALKDARADLDSLNSNIAAIATAPPATGDGSPVDNAALAALSQRIAALEKDVASLKTQTGSGDKATITTALSQALSDLKAKVAAGASFQAEYESIARMVPAAAGLDVLAAYAAKGIASPAGLAGELRDVVPSLPQPAEPAPPSDSYWDWLLESLSGIVTIRDIGEANWPLVAEKSAALAEAGDLTQAIALIDAAEGTKPTELVQWRDRAAARLALEAATGQVSEAVLRQIAAQGGAP